MGQLRSSRRSQGSKRQGVCSPREDQAEQGREKRHDAEAMAVGSGKGGTRPSEVGAKPRGGPFSMAEALGMASRNACVN